MFCRRRSPLVRIACLVMVGLAAASQTAPARASSLRMTVERPHFTCEGSGVALSHVAYRADAKPVLPCCDGRIGCAQFLSTSTVLRAPRRWHG